ncbi:hypothetical protein BN1221_03802 [Brenneria goodwinii]|uniref:Uncharacterized protein n=1 Tax=Brenneria goodwinii TaxID=1109412 RepID=A0A0G4JZL5_9GAMM|nr:hypothetical protein BN1221_03802 [Brenneria goodwinii]
MRVNVLSGQAERIVIAGKPHYFNALLLAAAEQINDEVMLWGPVDGAAMPEIKRIAHQIDMIGFV